MSTPLLYIFKSAFYLGSFYLVYTLLSRDTLYSRNRIFILLSAAASFILPLITIQTSKPVNLFFGKTLTEVLVLPSGNTTLYSTVKPETTGAADTIFLLYMAGVLVFVVRLLFDLSEILILILNKRNHEGNIIRFGGLGTSGFSAFGKIFINTSLSNSEAKEIIRHEQTHIDKLHFLDLILLEMVKIIQWFNPFAHLFNRSLRAVHEYQADEGCLQKGVPVINYQRLLLNQVFHSNVFSVSNSFSNPTLIKKRMIMMTKERSNTRANLKLLLVLPVVAIVMIAFSSCKDKPATTASGTEEIAPPPPPPPAPAEGYSEKKVIKGEPIPADAPPPPPPPPPFTVENGDTTWVVADEMPFFKVKDGDRALLEYIGKNVKYPENAVKNGIQGRVIVRFSVEKDGSIANAKVLKGVDPELDAEALRVVKSMPDFELPGYKNDKPVSVYYMVPITFALK